MQKILFICLAAYKVPSLTDADLLGVDRQTLYAIALHRLFNVMTPQTELIVVDNTVSQIKDLEAPLREQLVHSRIKDVILIHNNEYGFSNKGAGEYRMCEAVIKKHEPYIREFDWVVYYTSRYPISFPLVFEYMEKYPHVDAIVANATYLFSDGSVVPSAPGNFNDIIFTMKPSYFLNYVQSMSPDELFKKQMNSESNLYNFIIENNLNFKEVQRWGVLRYNYSAHRTELI